MSQEMALAIHYDVIGASESSGGVRDAGLLNSALERPKNLLFYEGDGADIFDLAACYAEAIARNHPFVDGNKRTAFITADIFLDLNGYRLAGDQEEQARMMTALAEGTLTRKAAADFLRRNSKAI